MAIFSKIGGLLAIGSLYVSALNCLSSVSMSQNTGQNTDNNNILTLTLLKPLGVLNPGLVCA